MKSGSCESSVVAVSEESLQPVASASFLPVRVRQLLSASLADSTRRAYRQDLADFQDWGGMVPCSPDVLATYIATRTATLSPRTITRRVVGIGRAHVAQGYADPSKSELVRSVLRGA